jgi:electron transfer flavoprotein alpha subunit
VLEGDLGDVARRLVAALAERGLLGPAAMAKAPSPSAKPRSSGDPARAVWVLAESLGGKLRRVTFELLGKGAELADATGGALVAVVLGHGVRALAAELAAHGADRVLVCDDPLLVDYSTDAYAGVLATAIRERAPRSLLVPSTALGRDLAPRVAARLGLGLTGDAIDLSLDPSGRLVQWKPAFGGNIVAPILSRTRPEMATVRPGMFEPPAAEHGREAVVEEIRIAEPPAIRTLVTEHRALDEVARAALLDECERAIGVGRGIGAADKLALLAPLAAALGGAPIAATRDVTDAGWLPRQHQVGLTGRAISPRLYVAIGIRGAFEHMVGVRRAGTIVAINKNPKAPIFSQADLGIVADWEAAVPLVTTEIASLSRSA